MKKNALLVFSAALVAIASCTKENASEFTFAGIEVEVGENNGNFSKLFVLNEGAFPGASTLDLMDFTHKKYCTDIFAQANPEVVQGLGNTGNDLAVVDGRLWVLMNASNQVAVLSLPEAKLERILEVDSPRFITQEGKYAYITSYAGAVYGSEEAVPGKLYRIDTKSFETSTLEVGYQPDGLAVLNGKLYVANSGGYNWVHDNRISVIDLATFKLEKNYEAPVTNLYQLYASSDKIWFSSYGESTWTQDENGEWIQSVSAPQSLTSMTPAGNFTVWEGVHFDKMTAVGNVLVGFGNDAEMSGGYEMCLYKVDTKNETFQRIPFAEKDLSRIGYAYGLLVNPDNGDLYICDANFKGGSKLHCFDASLKHKWTVDTGVGTGHLLLK